MKLIGTILIGVILGAELVMAAEDTVECEYRGYVAPIGDSPVQIHCREQDGSESTGFIGSAPKLNHIKVEIRDAGGVFLLEVTLPNPPQEIPVRLGWLEEQIQKKGIRGFSDDHKVYPARWGYGIDGTTVLYRDPGAGSTRRTVASNLRDDDTVESNKRQGPGVQWIAPPIIVASSPSRRLSSGTLRKSICVGRVSASTKFSKEILKLPNNFKTTLLCPTIGVGTCPSAADCIVNDEIQGLAALDPKGTDFDELYPNDKILK